MKAAVLYKKGDIRYADYPTPEVNPGEVKIAVKVSGICGSDVPRVLGDESRYYPNVLGHEFSGVVAEVGENVKAVSVGQHVTVAPLVPCHQCADCLKGDFALCKNYSFIGSRQQGSFAEYIVVPEINVVPLEENVSFEAGALFEPSTVALHGVLQNDYKPGGNVAILGFGNIGFFTAQWARILGARHVTVFDIDEQRLNLALKVGVDVAVNTKEENFKDKINVLIDRGGYDYIFETAGVISTMQLSFELASNKAKVCFIGTPHQELSYSPQQWEAMNRKEFKLTGSWMSYSAPFPGIEWILTAKKAQSGELKFDDALIFKRFSLRDVDQAFALFKNPAQVKGKVLILND